MRNGRKINTNNMDYSNKNTVALGNEIKELESELYMLCDMHAELNLKNLDCLHTKILIRKKETEMWVKTNEFLKLR
jgi:hypothetical protein